MTLNHENSVAKSDGKTRAYIAGVPDFWERVINAPHRLLAIDYDGTLAPFRIVRQHAIPLPGVKEALRDIRNSSGTSLAVLSGRPASQVRELLGHELSVPIYGSHGYELIYPDGTLSISKPSHLAERGLERAIEIAVAVGHGEHIERKIASVAIHTRALWDWVEVEQQFLNLWRPLTGEYNLAILHFNRGVELRANERHKGTAFADLYREMPLHTLPVYLGDDTTDEDVFRFVKPMGIGVKVGLNGLPTEATGQVPDEAAVLTILQDWLAAVGE